MASVNYTKIVWVSVFLFCAFSIIGLAVWTVWIVVAPTVIVDPKSEYIAQLDNQFVALADPSKPNSVLMWQFKASDITNLTVLDTHYGTDNNKTMFVNIKTTSNGQILSGILQIQYINIAGIYYPVALGSITLQIKDQPKDTTPKKDNIPPPIK
jgi:hypothetical protein